MSEIAEALARARERYSERTPCSAEQHERRRQVLPGGDTRQSVFFPPHPLVLAGGEGSWVTDVDGHRYVDLTHCFSAALLGHGHPAVVAAIAGQAPAGCGFTAATALEVDLAEAIAARVPSVEQVRLACSATEAALLAVRAARAATGRELVAVARHGFHSSYDHAELGTLGTGMPAHAGASVVAFEFNDGDDAERVVAEAGHDLAAVLVEPMLGVAGMIPPADGFLVRLAAAARAAGALVILDETITLRLAVGGGQERFATPPPDLTVMGKLLGGGLPMAAVGGSADVMSWFSPARPDRIRHSGTFLANPVSVAAGLAALAELDGPALHRLDTAGEAFAASLRDALASSGLPVSLTGTGSLWNLHGRVPAPTTGSQARAGDADLVGLLHLLLLGHGVLIGSRGLIATATSTGPEELEHAAAGFRAALGEMSALLDA